MAYRYLSWLLSAAILFLLPQRLLAQTVLKAGDLVVVGYSAQDPDDYAFTSLVDLAPGTQIRFTDNGWLPTSGFHATEGTCVYTAPAAGVPRGTVVGFRTDSLCFTHPSRFQLATDGDQLLVYQGPDAAPVFLFGLAIKKNWGTAISSNTSALPPGLSSGSSALFLPWANGAYSAAQARSGSASSLRAALTDATRWAGSNTARVSWPLTPFTFDPAYLTPPPAGADSLRIEQYLTLAHLDVSQVPGGLLAEYGMPLVPLAIFDGTLTDSSRTNDGVFRQLFATLATSRVYGPNRFPRLDTLMNRLDRRAAAPDGVIPIAIERIDYATLRPDALAANLLSWQGNQLYDVPGRSQSPYLARTAFVAGPARTYSATGNVTLVVPQALHVQIGGGVAQTPEIDFGDGRGYLPAAWDQPISVAYCDSGTHRIKLRLAYVLPGTPAQTTTYESHFDLLVRRPGCINARYANGGPDLLFPRAGYLDAGSGGKVSIRYGGNHTSLIKPLIVVEGYDPDFIAPKLGQGNYSVDNFLRNIQAIDVSSTPGVTNFNFREMLDDDNINPTDPNRPANYIPYDIVFIDFRNGTDDIRSNARLFKEVVRWVNANKQPNPGGQLEDNVVLGISMGGLVARYGLAQMEKAQAGSTHTRLLVTQDSPHRGANTPLGVQALARQAYSAANIITFLSPIEGLVLRAIFPNLDQVIALEEAPATRQLLLLYAEDGTGTTTTDGFLDGDYRSTITFPAGSPPPYRFIANSLGSQCGIGTLAPYSELARVEGGAFMRVGSFLKADYRLSFVVNALPNYGTAQRVSGLRLFVKYKVFGATVATHTLFSQTFEAPANVPGWDGAPGGTQPLQSRLPLGTGIYPTLDFWITGSDLNVQAADNFCFVPTVSALDIADINSSTLTGKYVGGVASSSFSRAANFMAQPTAAGQSNYQHPFFLGRQAHWLFNEMESVSTTPPLNCSNQCTSAPMVPITGPEIICAGSIGTTYSVAPPFGSVTDWTASPAGLVTLPATTAGATSITVTPDASGNTGLVTLTAHISNGCLTTTATRQVAIGQGYLVVSNTQPSPYGTCAVQTATFAITEAYGSTGPFTWRLYKSGVNYTVSPDTRTITITGLPFQNYGLYGSVEGPSTCPGGGAATGSFGQQYTTTYGGYPCQSFRLASPSNPTATLYPNPAKETVDVHVDNADAVHPVTVRLFDSYGRSCAEQTSRGEAALRLRTEKLPAGLYFVHILRGKEVLSRQQLQIEK